MLHILKKLGWYLKKEKYNYLLMLFLLLLISIVSLTPAYVFGKAIDIITYKELTRNKLILLVLLLILIPLFRYCLSFIYNYLINKQAQKLAYTLREKYLKHLFKMDLEFYEKYEKGELISIVTQDLENITIAATSLLEGIVFNFGVIIFAITIMSTTISLKLTLISVLIMPVGLTILNIIRNNKRKYVKIHREIYGRMTTKVLESTEGQKTIRAYVQEENDLKKLNKAIMDDINSWRYIVNYENWFNPLFEVIYGISYVLAFVFGVYFIINQELTVGGLITFVSYISQLYSPIISLSTIFSQINNATIAVDKYFNILKEEPKVKDEINSKDILDFEKIEYKDVYFKYPFDKEPVIKGISFELKNGETLGIVGPTGSGKSTIIRQLLREFNITKGSILIDGKDIKEYKIEDIRNLVGYVPQEHILFRKKVDDNILLGNPNANIKELNKAIKMADFEKDLLFLNDGLNTMVGESGSTLSGGQKQRLSIARALIKNPKILILDDSLSAVDANTENNIINELKNNRKNMTNIIIAHRFSAVRDANMILVINDGKIVQRGTHEQLLKEDGWYKEQYIKQMMK